MLNIKNFKREAACIGLVLLNFIYRHIYIGKSAIVPQLVPTVNWFGLLRQQLNICPAKIPP
jgi:hypothetical protein